jgi:hypothetical protein
VSEKLPTLPGSFFVAHKKTFVLIFFLGSEILGRWSGYGKDCFPQQPYETEKPVNLQMPLIITHTCREMVTDVALTDFHLSAEIAAKYL